jgi:hypothetical protein
MASRDRAQTNRPPETAWSQDNFSPRVPIDNRTPKKGAVEKMIWLRVAPSLCAAVM